MLRERKKDEEINTGSVGFPRINQWLSFFSNLFRLLLTVGKFTSVFQDKESLRSHQTAEIKAFINFVYLLMEGSISGAGSGSIKKYGSRSRRPKNIQILRIRLWKTGFDLC